MARDIKYYEHWQKHDGKKVLIDGHTYQLKVTTYQASYPYPHTVISVYAEPVNKASKMYLDTKRELKDDWSTDVLDSDISLQADILHQCGERA